MEDIRLYINGQLADLPADAARQIRLSKGGAEAADPDARSGDHSYSLTLPPTRRNHAIFGNRAQLPVVDKFRTAAPYTALLEVGAKPLLLGAFQLAGIRGGYTGRLVSEEVDVFTLLGEKTLRDLQGFAPWHYRGQYDFPALLQATAADSPVCFPLVAYGNFFAPAGEGEPDIAPSARILVALELDDYTPSVFYTAIIRQIFADIGWRATGEPLEDPFLAELCLPYVGEEYQWNWGELLKLDASAASIALSLSNVIREPYSKEINQLYWVLSPADTYNPARRYRPVAALGNRYAYGVRREGGYDVSLEVTVTASSSGGAWVGGVWVRLLKLQPGQPLLEGEVVAEYGVPGVSSIANGRYVATASNVFLAVGDQVVAVIETSEYASQPVAKSFTLADVRLQIAPAEGEIGPLHIDIAANLPELNQRAVVKSFVTLGNLRFVTDPRTRTITFYHRHRYELPADFAVELTGLADPELSEFLPATAARRFVFAWADDSQDALAQARKGFADLVQETRHGAGEGEQRLALPFAATVWRSYTEGERRLLLPCMATQEQLNAPLNTVSWSYGYTPRLIRHTGPSPAGDTLPLAFMGGRHAYGTSSFAGLTWPELYQRFYSDYLTELTRGHLLKNNFALSPELYRQLSPARPVLFEGILYRLSKVQGFLAAGSDTTEVELLHLVRDAVGGGKPRDAAAAAGQEFYGGEFYTGEWY